MENLDSFTTENASLIGESNISLTSSVRAPKRARVLKNWVFVESFENEARAKDVVIKEDTWKIRSTNRTKEGRKVIYRCNKVQKDMDPCPSELYLFYHCDSLRVDIYKTIEEHHHKVLKVFTPEVKKYIEKCVDDGMKSRAIWKKLIQKKIELKNKTQLDNYISRYRQRKYGSPVISVGDFLRWCKSNSSVPDDPNAPFVLSHYTNEESDKYTIRALITTKNMLSLVPRTNRLHADGTYKLNWEGLPTIVVGTTDEARTFRVIGIGIVSSETKADYEFIFRAIAESCPENKIR